MGVLGLQGSQRVTPLQGTISKTVSEQNLVSFARDVLEKSILPIYKTPYSHQVGNQFIKLNQLALKRPIHGCMHIARSILFAEMMMNMYTHKLSYKSEGMDPFAIRHAIAYHDIARNGDGFDAWEKESSEFALVHMTGLYNPQTVEEITYVESVAKLIDKKYCEVHLSEEINQLITHAADTIEILRVRDVCDFNRSLFHFLSPEHDPIAREILSTGLVDIETLCDLREQFIQEANAWIEKTDSFDNKVNLESSSSYFIDLVKQFEKRKDQFPLLSSLFQG